MSITEIRPKYKTPDGEEFNTKEEAERHAKVLSAIQEVEESRKRLGQILAEQVITADGQPFRLENFWGSFYIDRPYGFPPRLQQIEDLNWHFEFGEYNGKVVATRYDYDSKIYGYRKKEYVLSDLYADRRAAERAVLKEQQEWLAEETAKIEKERARIG